MGEKKETNRKGKIRTHAAIPLERERMSILRTDLGAIGDVRLELRRAHLRSVLVDEALESSHLVLDPVGCELLSLAIIARGDVPMLLQSDHEALGVGVVHLLEEVDHRLRTFLLSVDVEEELGPLRQLPATLAVLLELLVGGVDITSEGVVVLDVRESTLERLRRQLLHRRLDTLEVPLHAVLPHAAP
jgi:hypothetical protein